MHPRRAPPWRDRGRRSRVARAGGVHAREVERLIADEAIPPDRQIVYALETLAGLRHGAIAGLRGPGPKPSSSRSAVWSWRRSGAHQAQVDGMAPSALGLSDGLASVTRRCATRSRSSSPGADAVSARSVTSASSRSEASSDPARVVVALLWPALLVAVTRLGPARYSPLAPLRSMPAIVDRIVRSRRPPRPSTASFFERSDRIVRPSRCQSIRMPRRATAVSTWSDAP